METIKSYTDIEQSKKLAEFLPIESADMYYQYVLPKSDKIRHTPENGNPAEALEWYNKGYTHFGKEPITMDEYCVPCWSLAALLEVMPKSIRGTTAFDEEEDWLPFFFYPRLLLTDKQIWKCVYKEYNGGGASKCWTIGESPIDACYEMIIRLNELKLLQL